MYLVLNFLSQFWGSLQPSAPIPAFYIDRTEVTNAAYKSFCDATSRHLPDAFPPDKPAYPVVNVSILDANEFAKWAGESLPSALQWEKAARGTDGRLFPWGNNKDETLANLGPNGHILPAAGFPKGASPFGALNMVGNVWEMVFELTPPSDHQLHNPDYRSLNPPPTREDSWYQIRGGSFKEGFQDGLIWDASAVPSRWKNTNIGFRCVKEAR